MNKILNFGSLNIDYVYKLDHIVRKGETITSTALNVYSGGKGLNQSVALGKAGLRTFHAGQIGPDGMFLLDVLKKANVDVSHVRVNDMVRTGNALIQNDKDGDNCIILYPGANRAITKDLVDSVLADFGKGDYLVLQNEINCLGLIINKAHEKGMTIVLNPSPMDDHLNEIDLSKIDWFLLNEVEAAQLTGADPFRADELSDALKMKFPHAKIVLTLGGSGSRYIDRDQVICQDAFHVKAVDTTAAGDTFTGFFLSGIISGRSVKDALQLASRAAAIAVSRPGAAPSIPTMEEVLAAEKES